MKATCLTRTSVGHIKNADARATRRGEKTATTTLGLTNGRPKKQDFEVGMQFNESCRC